MNEKGNAAIIGIIAVAIGWTVVSSFWSEKAERSENYLRSDDYRIERSYAEYSDRDCNDFSSQSEAQEFFEDQGGPDEDYHNLDRDGDGIACESLK